MWGVPTLSAQLNVNPSFEMNAGSACLILIVSLLPTALIPLALVTPFGSVPSAVVPLISPMNGTSGEFIAASRLRFRTYEVLRGQFRAVVEPDALADREGVRLAVARNPRHRYCSIRLEDAAARRICRRIVHELAASRVLELNRRLEIRQGRIDEVDVGARKVEMERSALLGLAELGDVVLLDAGLASPAATSRLAPIARAAMENESLLRIGLLSSWEDQHAAGPGRHCILRTETCLRGVS